MEREERDRLIDEENRNYRKTSKTKIIMICCCVCILIIILLLMMVFWFVKKHKSHSEQNHNLTSSDWDLCRIGIPQNMSALFTNGGNLCSNTSEKEEPDVSNSPPHIYIIKTSSNLSDEQACGVESVLRLFPDKTIFIIDFSKQAQMKYDRCSSPPNYLGLLLYLYKDRIELIFADRREFFKGTPLQNVSTVENKLEFLAMLVTAYKYGGFVATPNMVIRNRELVECLPEQTIVEPFAILTSKKCDDFLEYMMESFSSCGLENDSSLDEILSKSVDLYTRSAASGATARRLETNEVCLKPDESCTFIKLVEFPQNGTNRLCDLSTFCKQVVQAFLGLRMNQMEVEEETSKIKFHIASNRRKCKPPNKLFSGESCS